jgi:hypothetical protein
MEDAKPSASETPCKRMAHSQAHVAGPSMAMDDSEELDNEEEDPMEEDSHDSNDVEEEENGRDDEVNSDAWSEGSDDEDQYHTANRRQFSFHDIDSGEDEDESQQETSEAQRSAWIRRQFARIHVLRALASMEDQAMDAEN